MVSVIDQPTRRARASGSMRCAALADHAHEEITEAIIQFLDVNEHPHPQIVRRAER
jgi:hypothetical protein